MSVIDGTCPICGATIQVALPLRAPTLHPLGGVDLPIAEDPGVDEYHAVFVGPHGVDVRCGWGTV